MFVARASDEPERERCALPCLLELNHFDAGLTFPSMRRDRGVLSQRQNAPCAIVAMIDDARDAE
jgi:hypothetical protein